jgi:hypothetical protein
MKRRVALVVTGRLEFRGLAPALERLFPCAAFAVTSTLSEMDLKDSTSIRVDPTRNAREAARLAQEAAGESSLAIDQLVAHLAASLCERDPPDLAVLVEDLELANRHNEAHVLHAVHESVERHLARVARLRHAPRDLAGRLRERASFHLFDPMIETYFFEDPAALAAAQGGLGRVACRVAGQDCERFEVDVAADPEYLAPTGECPRHRRPRDRRCPWDGDDRRIHPKKYLKYLCREAPPDHYCSSYQETAGGVQALARLDWNRVLATPGSAPFLRALVDDLAEGLGTAPALQDWTAAPASEAPTSRARAPQARVLRNL